MVTTSTCAALHPPPPATNSPQFHHHSTSQDGDMACSSSNAQSRMHQMQQAATHQNCEPVAHNTACTGWLCTYAGHTRPHPSLLPSSMVLLLQSTLLVIPQLSAKHGCDTVGQRANSTFDPTNATLTTCDNRRHALWVRFWHHCCRLPASQVWHHSTNPHVPNSIFVQWQ
jgi:hypothetical protein